MSSTMKTMKPSISSRQTDEMTKEAISYGVPSKETAPSLVSTESLQRPGVVVLVAVVVLAVVVVVLVEVVVVLAVVVVVLVVVVVVLAVVVVVLVVVVVMSISSRMVGWNVVLRNAVGETVIPGGSSGTEIQ